MKLRRLVVRFYSWVGGGWGMAQLGLLLIAAGLAGPAAVAYSNANDAWQQAARAEVARSAALQEVVRAVYGDEAPATLRVIQDEQRAAELASVVPDNQLVRMERAVSEETASSLRSAYRRLLPGTLAADPRYRTSSEGADVIARLRDLRQTELDRQVAAHQPVSDPQAAVRAGDASAARGLLLSLGAGAISLVVAVLALIYYRPRHLRPAAPEVAELVEYPRLSEKGSRRRTALVILALWAAGAVLPLSQVVLGAEEQRAQAASARLAAVLTTDIAVSNARASFETQARQTAREFGVRAAVRREAADHLPATDATDHRTVADAESRTAERVERIAIAMSRSPDPSDRLEPRLTQALASEPDDWNTTLNEQNAQTVRANRWGHWSNNTSLLIMVITGFAAFAAVHHKYLRARPTRNSWLSGPR